MEDGAGLDALVREAEQLQRLQQRMSPGIERLICVKLQLNFLDSFINGPATEFHPVAFGRFSESVSARGPPETGNLGALDWVRYQK